MQEKNKRLSLSSANTDQQEQTCPSKLSTAQNHKGISTTTTTAVFPMIRFSAKFFFNSNRAPLDPFDASSIVGSCPTSAGQVTDPPGTHPTQPKPQRPSSPRRPNPSDKNRRSSPCCWCAAHSSGVAAEVHVGQLLVGRGIHQAPDLVSVDMENPRTPGKNPLKPMNRNQLPCPRMRWRVRDWE